MIPCVPGSVKRTVFLTFLLGLGSIRYLREDLVVERIMANLPEVDDSNFEVEVLKADLPVLVDFGAEWCHPCRQLDPIVEELAEEWNGRVKVVKLDIDANMETTMRFGVMGVPTLILFLKAEPIERISGFLPKKRIVAKLAPHLDG